MEGLRVALCEDSPQERQALLELLAGCALPARVTVFDSGEALLAAFAPHAFDLLLVDIYLGGITGVETVRQVRRLDRGVPVAFVTTSQAHALEGYRLSVLMYLEKPVAKEKLEELLELARMKRDAFPALVVWQEGKPLRLPLDDILYLEQQKRQVVIRLAGGRETAVYEKLSNLTQQLEGRPFFQPHKSYLVHLEYVADIDAELRCFLLTDGEKIPIRRDLMGKARRAWEDFLFARLREMGMDGR